MAELTRRTWGCSTSAEPSRSSDGCLDGVVRRVSLVGLDEASV